MKPRYSLLWMLFAIAVPLLPLKASEICQEQSIQADTPLVQFIIAIDGTVTDTKTGLMWKQCPEGLAGPLCDEGVISNLNWQQALEASGNVNASGGYAGFADWRVPTVAELATITELQCFRPAINLNVFPNTPNNFFWTSSPNFKNADSSWVVSFSDGAVANQTRTDVYSVRLVRSGQ